MHFILPEEAEEHPELNQLFTYTLDNLKTGISC